jgi:hypothetical protein
MQILQNPEPATVTGTLTHRQQDKRCVPPDGTALTLRARGCNCNRCPPAEPGQRRRGGQQPATAR